MRVKSGDDSRVENATISERNGRKTSSIMTSPSLNRFVAGSTSGLVSAVLLQPLDVVKTLSIQRASSRSTLSGTATRLPLFAGLKENVRLTLLLTRRRGVMSLYSGTSAAAARLGIGAGLYFTTLDWFLQPKRKKQKDDDGNASSSSSSSSSSTSSTSGGDRQDDHEALPARWIFVYGCVSRGIAAAAQNPLTVAKTRMEALGWKKVTRAAPWRYVDMRSSFSVYETGVCMFVAGI